MHPCPIFIGRGAAPGTEIVSLETPGSRRAYVQTYITAFPDLHWDIERVIANGDDVVVEWIGSGTNTGHMRGPTGANLPPTNRRARVRGNTILRFKNGKIAQSRVLFDSGDLMQQLGLMPGAAGQTSPGMPVSTARGIVHLEIPAADREVAARFYGEMFGWEYEHMGEPMNYTTFKTGNVPGGFPSLSDMYKPGDVIFYVESEDISSDLRRAERLGAKTAVPCTEIPGYGWFAILTDPTGNRVGLFSA